MNRVEFDAAELPVYATDKLVDGSTEVAVFLDVLTRGYSDLQELDFADPLRMCFEEVL